MIGATKQLVEFKLEGVRTGSSTTTSRPVATASCAGRKTSGMYGYTFGAVYSRLGTTLNRQRFKTSPS